MERSIPRTPHGAWWQADSSKQERNRRASNPLSPASKLHSSALITGGLEPSPAKPPHINPPIPLFKIPPAQWPIVLQRVAQGESLRQIARGYHTSYEAVRRVLSAARQGMLVDEGAVSTLNRENTEQEPLTE
jgi:hypothetical protein